MNVCVGLVRRTPRRQRAFTLIELLVVLAIFTVLAAIALPTVRGLLKDGKAAHQARQITTFLREARSRAIATKSEVGVLFDRFGSRNDFERSVCVQMRLSNAVPPYTGELPGAAAILFHQPAGDATIPGPATPALPPMYDPERSAALPNPAAVAGPTNAAFFTAADAPLLHLSALNGGGQDQPIGVFDRLEFQGGRTVIIRGMVPVAAANSNGYGEGTKVLFDPRERLYVSSSSNTASALPTVLFPNSPQFRAANAPVTRARFKIHRKPNISAVGTVTLLKGMAIDLNYSGFGPTGVQLSQFAIAPTAGPATDVDCGPVGIVFAPDGTVSYMNYSVSLSGAPIQSIEHPSSNIYLCVGKIDGVRPDSLYDTSENPPANLMDLESSWIVINPFTGHIDASPMASVNPSGLTNAGQLGTAVLRAREFAFQSDKLSKY